VYALLLFNSNGIQESDKMVKYKLKTNPVGQIYFPKEIREELGQNLELIANARSALIFPEGEPINSILRSLGVIKKDLENRLKLQKTEAQQPTVG